MLLNKKIVTFELGVLKRSCRRVPVLCQESFCQIDDIEDIEVVNIFPLTFPTSYHSLVI